MSREKKRKIMDEVRDYMRLHHYSIHTEKSYCDWIGRFIKFHQMKSRADFENGEDLYRKVLKKDPDQKINATHAKRRQNLPVVMTREEAAMAV